MAVPSIRKNKASDSQAFAAHAIGAEIRGSLEFTLRSKTIILNEGDSYSFDAHIPHHGRNRTNEEAVLVWAVSPVVIPKKVEQS